MAARLFDLAYVDNPWAFNHLKTGGSMRSGSAAHYATLPTSEICRIPNQSVMAPDSLPFMWFPLQSWKTGTGCWPACGYDHRTLHTAAN